LILTAAVGCRRPPPAEETVVLYTSVDEPFARQVVRSFEQASGLKVQMVTDLEAGKTTGLVRRIEAERANPRADVFWSSELFNTIRLARAGLLAEYRPPAEGIPERYRDPGGRWTAFGVRGRVLAFNTQRVSRGQVPNTWQGIADPAWAGRLAVADPRFGTTGGHFAAMYALWGPGEYAAFLERLRGVAGPLVDGNATSARQVGSGEKVLGVTDTDDVFARQARGEPVDLAYPDLGDGGTLLVPNSVGLIAGAPHAANARKLIDFLASAQAERLLAASESRNVPVRAALREELKMDWPAETKVPFERIADVLEEAIRLAHGKLAQ
jgi:iron(III) transport system substrate-binding protein